MIHGGIVTSDQLFLPGPSQIGLDSSIPIPIDGLVCLDLQTSDTLSRRLYLSLEKRSEMILGGEAGLD